MRRFHLAVPVCLAFLACSPDGIGTKEGTKFSVLYKEVKTTQAALQVGVTYRGFGDLIQKMVTELSMVEDKVKTEDDKQILQSYIRIVDMYKDSFKAWGISFAQKIDSRHMPYDLPEGWLMVNDDLKQILTKYPAIQPKEQKQKNGGGTYQIVRDDSLRQLIWVSATIEFKKMVDSHK